MADAFTPYETGLTRLLGLLGSDHPCYVEALTLQARLMENIAQTRSCGDTETRRAERAQIVKALNQLTLETVGNAFNDLYLSSLESSQAPQWEPTADPTRAASMEFRTQAEHTDRLETILTASLKQKTEQAELINQLTTITVPQPDNVPLPPTIYAPRKDLIHNLCHGLSDVTWLAMVDGPGKGKTQLARAIARAFGLKHVWWISLRSHEAISTHQHLEQQMARWLVELRDNVRYWDLYIRGWMNLTRLTELVSESVGADGLLVVDNLPDPLQDELLFHHLKSVATVFATRRTKLLTTSQRDLPPILRIDLSALLSVIQPPPFSGNDIFEMLESAEAPNEVRTDNVVSLILGATNGHPSLVAAAVHWLRRQEWQLRSDDWITLLTGEAVEDVRGHERRRMLQLFDDRPKEFLYRLSLLWTEFDRPLAIKIAAVSPVVEYPGECLDELVGPCLSRLERNRYEVTPLLRNAGQANLVEDVQMMVHRVVADHYLSQGTIDASQASTIAAHLFKASDHPGFATFLIQFMLSMKTPAQAKYFDWATRVFSPDMEWPSELPLDLRIMLRAAQVRIRALAEGDVTALDADLERLIAQAGSDESRALLFAYANTGLFLLNRAKISPEIAVQRAIQAVRLLRTGQLIPEEEIHGKYEDIVWLAAAHLEKNEQIHQFLQQVCQMTDEERTRLFEVNLATEATPRLIDRIWMSEADKPNKQQDWDGILKSLDRVHEIATLPNTVPLQVAEARARAVVLADYLGQPNAALRVLDVIPAPTNSDLVFLLHYTAGRIRFDAGQLKDALQRFDAAAATGGDSFSYYRLDTERRAAIVQSKLGEWDDAKQRCVEVIHLASKMSELFEYDRLEMMGELAWINWATGNRKKTCAAMYGFVTGLIAIGDETEPRFRQAFNKAMHSIGWFSSMASTGQPPTATRTDEPCIPVEAGMFGILRERLGDYVPPFGFSKALLLNQLGMLAEALLLSRMAWKTYKFTESSAQEGDSEVILGIGKMKFASLAARFGHPAKAIALGLQAIKALAVGKRLHENGIDVLDRSVKCQDVWETISDQERRSEERLLMEIVFGPAFSELLGADLLDGIEERAIAWERAVSIQRASFEDPEFWDEVAQILRKLGSVRAGKLLREEDLDIPEEAPILKILWYLVGSDQPRIRLVDSLRMHLVALDFLIKPANLGEHMLPGVGKFLHGFWLDIANTRGFALNSPRLFREELLRISPEQGAKTAVQVLRSASRAVGIPLPDEILANFRRIGKP